MGKKSRLKEERRAYKLPPITNELLTDYFLAQKALETGPGIAFFRGQPVTDDSLYDCLCDEGAKHGISQTDMMIEVTLATRRLEKRGLI